MTNPPYDPAQEGAQMSFDGRMSYGDYLGLDHILPAQNPLSSAHDEMLFMIQHQTSELWMRLAIHELDAARIQLQTGDMRPAFKMLARLSHTISNTTPAMMSQGGRVLFVVELLSCSIVLASVFTIRLSVTVVVPIV